jgi:hypothetical protein
MSASLSCPRDRQDCASVHAGSVLRVCALTTQVHLSRHLRVSTQSSGFVSLAPHGILTRIPVPRRLTHALSKVHAHHFVEPSTRNAVYRRPAHADVGMLRQYPGKSVKRREQPCSHRQEISLRLSKDRPLHKKISGATHHSSGGCSLQSRCRQSYT